MKIYNKPGQLFLVQIDHLSGEIIGDVIESFYQAGAKNVQVFSTITKKNRPGHVILIDAPASVTEAMEDIIVMECGSSGWHRIDTCHRHTDVSCLAKTIRIRISDDIAFDFPIRGKQIADDRQGIRPEYDSCAALQKELLNYQKRISIRKLQSILTQAFLLEDLEENNEIPEIHL
ncbi:MAG: LarC family nickel insertion protein [Lachnospiraceae bacterium]|nr:LarC family nickel insertion protein [Lachnospiraceae bacterium]